MNWNKGMSLSLYANKVNKNTWTDLERFEIISGSISNSDSNLRASADLECKDYNQDREEYIRIYMDCRQDGSSAHIPIFTGLATSPDRDINGKVFTNGLQCYSVLKPAQDVLLQRGWYAPAGVPGTNIIKTLFNILPAPIEIEPNAPALTQAIIAEDGESNLSMVEKILNVINWRINLKGDGTILICPKATTVSANFDPINNDSIQPEITEVYDWYECPNVFRAVKDDLSAIARDNNADSFLSIQNRGREVWKEETNCNLNEQESIADYAMRRLKEEQEILKTVTYTRRFMPDLYVGDLINLNYPAQKIVGNFKIISQKIDYSKGLSVNEEAQKV